MPKAATKPRKSSPTKAAAASAGSKTRRLKSPKYQSFRLKKKVRIQRPPTAGSFRLMGRSLLVLKNNWRPFLAITIIYGVLNVVLVRGLAGGVNLTDLKNSLHQAFGGSGGQLATGFALFVYLLGGSGNSSSANAGVYQTVLLVIVSLAVIWALRQVYAGERISAATAFYRGMYPLIPFILILLVIGLQLIPMLAGGLLYSTVISGGIAVYAVEKLLWALLFFLLALLSLYMLTSSLFALYVVTLPDMTPMKALRSARQLVRGRRWVILRKILFLPLALLIMSIVIMFPLILFVTPVAAWSFFVLSMAGLVVVNSYMYALYRELLA